jgi:hypothetical protein
MVVWITVERWSKIKMDENRVHRDLTGGGNYGFYAN